MNTTKWMRRGVIGALGALVALNALSAEPAKVDIGRREYMSNCASCHGATGRGDGINKPWLTRTPADLTVLAKANGGVFPIAHVYEAIDGRRDVAAHGSREMPVWGIDYNVKAAEFYVDVPYDADVYVRGKILSLIDDLYRLQAR